MPLGHEPIRRLERRADNHGDDKPVHDDDSAPPLSPRVRRRLDDAKENASVFGPGMAGFVRDSGGASVLTVMSMEVCEQGEVIQWLSACHPDLIALGRRLEQRGYKTLSSLAFLTEDELGSDQDGADSDGVASEHRTMLLAALATLRHDLFRM